MFTLQYMIYIFISKAAPCTLNSAHARLRALFLRNTARHRISLKRRITKLAEPFVVRWDKWYIELLTRAVMILDVVDGHMLLMLQKKARKSQ
jgi:hypothetical protein